MRSGLNTAELLVAFVSWWIDDLDRREFIMLLLGKGSARCSPHCCPTFRWAFGKESTSLDDSRGRLLPLETMKDSHEPPPPRPQRGFAEHPLPSPLGGSRSCQSDCEPLPRYLLEPGPRWV